MSNSQSKNKIMIGVAVVLLAVAAFMIIRALLPAGEAAPLDPGTPPPLTGGPREMK